MKFNMSHSDSESDISNHCPVPSTDQTRSQRVKGRVSVKKTSYRCKRSHVWNYFAHIEFSDGTIDRTKVKCNLCGRVLGYFSTTTNMSSHLKSRHYSVCA